MHGLYVYRRYIHLFLFLAFVCRYFFIRSFFISCNFSKIVLFEEYSFFIKNNFRYAIQISDEIPGIYSYFEKACLLYSHRVSRQCCHHFQLLIYRLHSLSQFSDSLSIRTDNIYIFIDFLHKFSIAKVINYIIVYGDIIVHLFKKKLVA